MNFAPESSWELLDPEQMAHLKTSFCSRVGGSLDVVSGDAQAAPPLFRKTGTSPPSNAIWLYRPARRGAALPLWTAGNKITDFWSEILRAVALEHPGKNELKVVLYPCAPLQTLERD